MAHGAACYRQEAIHLLLTWRARRTTGAAGVHGAVALVVTDAPDDFRAILGEGDDVRYLPVDAAQLTAWRGGPQGYIHRIKPLAILHAVASVQGCADDAFLFVDSDTSFLADPAPLFAAVHAGDVFLHEREGTIAGNRRHTRSQGRLHAMSRTRSFTIGGRAQRLAPDLPLWNSGAIGLRGDRFGLIAETLELTDAIHAVLPIATAEQVALAAVLAAHRIVPRPAAPWLLHYHVFKEFRDDLAAFFAHHRGTPPDGWIALLPQVDPQRRIAPKLAFNRQPKWWRQLRKAVGRSWRPLPYPWLT